MVQIEVMKTEVITYKTPADSIKSLVERKDDKGQDTFDISDWWKTNCSNLPVFTYVLPVVLTNSPNSFPIRSSPSYVDYIQLSIQSQFNNRAI